MAKINHNNYLDTINVLIDDAKSRGILHLQTDDNEFTGREFPVDGRDLLNFGTCGYMGLETDPRLKEKAIEYVQKYGTQFSVSRTYLTFGPNAALEEKMSAMYGGQDVIVYSSTSTAHISIVPSIVRDGHAIILDQQVHMSVQTACQLVRPRGIPVEMIRHSNLDMLERRLQEWSGKYQKVWFMIDGVYSMFGDLAPLLQLRELMNRYQELHIYVDDAHGVGWYGKNGAGYVYEILGRDDRVMLVTTLAKGFGAIGGLAVFPNKTLFSQVKAFGGPLTYSHPLPPAVIGSAMAAADIHLSDEIYTLQEELQSSIRLCNRELEAAKLPVVSDPLTPIYFVGMGQPKVGFRMVKRLFNDGFYVNLGMFPAVPVKCTGLRFCLNRHNRPEDIKALTEAIAFHFPKALEEEGRTENDVRKAFHMPPIYREQPAEPIAEAIAEPEPIEIGKHTLVGDLTVQYANSIADIDAKVWDAMMENRGSFSAAGLSVLEKSFSGNSLPEDNWTFHYYIIRGQDGEPVLATFLTEAIFKDDFVSPAGVSMQVETRRKKDPYYLTSHTLCMGSMITEGRHLFLDKNHSEWKKAVKLLLDSISELQEAEGIQNVVLRDFDLDDFELREFLSDEGFFKVDMPNANVITGLGFTDTEDFLKKLSAKSRAHIRNEVLKYEHYFDIEIKDTLSPEEVKHFHSLYMQIKTRNFAINYFPYPEKLMSGVSDSNEWEFIILRLKPDYDVRPDRPAVSIGACYKGKTHFVPLLLGLDYEFSANFQVYKQSLWAVVKRANELGKDTVYFGLSADTDKRKFGAKQVSRVAYLQAKDNFNFEMLETMSVIDGPNPAVAWNLGS